MKVVKGSGFTEIKAADLTAGYVGQTKDAVHAKVAEVKDVVCCLSTRRTSWRHRTSSGRDRAISSLAKRSTRSCTPWATKARRPSAA